MAFGLAQCQGTPTSKEPMARTLEGRLPCERVQLLEPDVHINAVKATDEVEREKLRSNKNAHVYTGGGQRH